ncbi:HAUS augmin-like complex subunit 1 [Takifugu flavidus]|uniref:HAUS augmin-like complex subunit 1 n=1 Tax=Takifugu flavidus TaxID=433684 RepID=A0A5C6P741_9TELE|nr:HAUS augmin-like complex subunit 1 [Takifugu flavidus]
MCEKINKVNSWLSSVFGDQPVPHFEVTSRTVELLHQLAQLSEARCGDTALLVEDLKQKASEYEADGAHLRDVLLQGAGLSYTGLSKPASDYLSALVDTAMVLGVRDTSLSSFMPAVNNLTNDLLEAEKSHRRLERELRALRKRLGATLMLRNTLQEDVNKTVKSQAVESAKAEERLLNMDFVTAKAKELGKRRERAEVWRERAEVWRERAEVWRERAEVWRERAGLWRRGWRYGERGWRYGGRGWRERVEVWRERVEVWREEVWRERVEVWRERVEVWREEVWRERVEVWRERVEVIVWAPPLLSPVPTLQAQLVSRNMDPSVTHQAIVQLSEDVAALKQEIIPSKKKLEPYMDLSPNPSLAQVKIEEAKRELAALDSQLELNMDFK